MTWDPGSVQCNGAQSTSWPSRIKACESGFEGPLREGFFNGTTKRIIKELVIDIPASEYVRKELELPQLTRSSLHTKSRNAAPASFSLSKPNQEASCQQRKAYCVVTALTMLIGHENLCVSPIRLP